jgi:iron(III) transport system substrate-binding protein
MAAHGRLGHRIALASLTGLGLAALTFGASAQTAADVAMFSGPDRMDRIIAGAKKEGTFSLYSSSPVEDMGGIIAGFEKQYGLKVKVWRGSSEDIRQRTVAEARAGRADVDVLEFAGTDMEAMHREQLLQEVRSPTLADLIPGAVPAHREWVTSRLSVFTALYNTNLIKAADAPKTYADLLDPKWKGKLGIEAEDSNWFMAVADAEGEAKTVDLFRRIVATNGVSVRKGHTLLANLVPSGEVPLALTVYGYKADQMLHAGAPVQPLLLPPPVALLTAVAVAKSARNPHAAVLFWEYFLTDGQKILIAQDNMPSNRKVKEPPPGLIFTNAAKLLDEGDRWSKLYKDVFRAR